MTVLTASSKPGTPFIIGQHWTVTEHFPLELPIDRCCGFEPEAHKEAWSIDSLHAVSDTPPTSGSYGKQNTSLRIIEQIEEIRVGDSKTSQVVLVEVVSGQYSGKSMVAKFYDLLYYDDEQDDVGPCLVWRRSKLFMRIDCLQISLGPKTTEHSQILWDVSLGAQRFACCISIGTSDVTEAYPRRRPYNPPASVKLTGRQS